MIPLDFLEFTPPSKDDRYLGIVSVKWGGLVLRYKITPTPDGKGYFVNPPKYKTINPITLEDKYLDSFEIDSKMETNRIIDFVKSHAKVHLNQTSVNPSKPIMPPGSGGWAHPTGPSNVPDILQQNLPF